MSLINYYDKLPKKYTEAKTKNPGFNIHGIKLPAFICVSGRTGSGKTNAVINFLQMSNNTFDKVIICCKNFQSDPLYRYIKDKNPSCVDVYENKIPPISEFEVGKQYFCILDDMVNESTFKLPIQAFFKYGRKVGISCAFLTQDYFATDSFIRKNMNNLWLFPSNTKTELNNIIRNFPFMTEYTDVIDKALLSKKNSNASKPLDFININCINCTARLNFDKI